MHFSCPFTVTLHGIWKELLKLREVTEAGNLSERKRLIENFRFIEDGNKITSAANDQLIYKEGLRLKKKKKVYFKETDILKLLKVETKK